MDTRAEFKRWNEESSTQQFAFNLIDRKNSQRRDLHAFMLLDTLLPDNKCIVAAAEHDIIYLSIDMDKLDKVASPEDILDLVRCGIGYDAELDCLYAFS